MLITRTDTVNKPHIYILQLLSWKSSAALCRLLWSN